MLHFMALEMFWAGRAVAAPHHQFLHTLLHTCKNAFLTLFFLFTFCLISCSHSFLLCLSSLLMIHQALTLSHAKPKPMLIVWCSTAGPETAEIPAFLWKCISMPDKSCLVFSKSQSADSPNLLLQAVWGKKEELQLVFWPIAAQLSG